MGTRLTPSFANLYMYHFEVTYVYPNEKQLRYWLRYIDDIFMIWDHGQFELDKFISHLNNASESITFSSEISPKSLP